MLSNFLCGSSSFQAPQSKTLQLTSRQLNGLGVRFITILRFLGAVVQAPRPMSRREREEEDEEEEDEEEDEEEEENRGSFVFNC